MATNEFLPWATAGGANVLSQSDYAAAASRLAGVIAGPASSALANKTWRQAAAISAMMGKFIAEIGGLDALDNGDIDVLLDRFVATYRAQKPNYIAVPTGTANALTVTLDPAPSTWAELIGTPFKIVIAATNTAAATLAVTGLAGTKPIITRGGAASAGGDLLTATIAEVVYDGTNVQILGLSPSNLLAVPSLGSLLAVKIYATAGTFAYTPTAGTKFNVIEGAGAGGAGGGVPATGAGNAAGGGGGTCGATGTKLITSVSAQTITIGAPGLGVAGSGGGSGNTTSYGSLLTLPGGAGGGVGNVGSVAAITGSIGTSSAPTGADFGTPGSGAMFGFALSSGSAVGGQGGSCPYGAGGIPNGANGTTANGGANGVGNGSGGAGAVGINSGLAAKGGDGRPGILIVYEYAG